MCRNRKHSQQHGAFQVEIRYNIEDEDGVHILEEEDGIVLYEKHTYNFEVIGNEIYIRALDEEAIGSDYILIEEEQCLIDSLMLCLFSSRRRY